MMFFLKIWLDSESEILHYPFGHDVTISRKWLTLNMTRKLFNTLALWGPAVALIGIGFLSKDQTTLAITLMTVNAALNAGTTIGSLLAMIDMSPNHSGLLMAIVNGIGNLFPLLSPLLVGVVVTDTSNRSQWQIVFALTGIVFFFGNLVFLIWGDVKRQPWDAIDYLQSKDQENTQSNEMKITDDGDESLNQNKKENVKT